MKLFSVLLLVATAIIAVVFVSSAYVSTTGNEEEALYCRLEGNVPDCDCDFNSVNGAVKNFLAPLLKDLTSRTYFRYFRVNMDRPCPFWHEDGQCHMEKCSVCACSEEEIPRTWVNHQTEYDSDFEHSRQLSLSIQSISSDHNNMGWISPEYGSMNANAGLESISLNSSRLTSYHSKAGKKASSTIDNDSIWIDMSEREDSSEGLSNGGIFVNLLENPERFTGYSGVSARRVWNSILEENCFGGTGNDEVCTEKRVFFRVIRGLQASISTLLSREYYFPDKTWGENIPLFMRAVGSHPDRLRNLYFVFLFTLRAVVKAGDFLSNVHVYDTGNKQDDKAVKMLIKQLVGMQLPANMDMSILDGMKPSAGVGVGVVASDYINPYKDAMTGLLPTSDANGTIANNNYGFCGETTLNAMEQCRNGFDESHMFQVSDGSNGLSYWEQIQQKNNLMEEFRMKFKNISRVMDCVSCEKCKVWGKLQILGLGTAVRILLTPEQELTTNRNALNRQEIIALINTLHQFTKSVMFANSVSERLQLQYQQLRDGTITENELIYSPPTTSTLEGMPSFRDYTSYRNGI